MNDKDFYDESEKNVHHVVPKNILARVCAALLTLTALTVITSRFHLGAFAAPVAFVIALAKALLVITFFMGMKYDRKLNRIIFGAAFFFLGVLFFFCALDIFTRIAQTSTL